MPLHERDDFVPGIVPGDRGADDESGESGIAQRACNLIDQARIGPHARAARRGMIGSQGRSRSSTGTGTNVGPHGACIAM